MKKKILAFIVAGTMVLSVGCGQSDSNEGNTKATTESESEVITVAQTTSHATETTKAKTHKKHKKETTTQKTTTEEVTTTVKPTTVAETTAKKVESTTRKVTKKLVKKKEKKTEKRTAGSNNKAIAKKYIGKSLDSLTAKIGKYSSFDKADSCLEEGESDGFFYYDGFTVTASTKNGKWVVTGVQ